MRLKSFRRIFFTPNFALSKDDSMMLIGIKEEDIPKLVNVLCRGDGRDGTIEGFIKLNEEDCTKIYKMMV